MVERETLPGNLQHDHQLGCDEVLGVDSATALARLESAVSDQALARLARGTEVDLEDALDEAAQATIAGWLEAVLDEPVGQSAQHLSAARLAYLAANADGSWSDSFLFPNADTSGLRAVMRAVYMMATPPMVPCQIERQSL